MNLRIAQITDCHLQAEASTLYKGINADHHLDQCLAWLQAQEAVDLLLLTGDLSHFGSGGVGGSGTAYHRLQQKVAKLNVPNIWLTGNHDNSEAMQQVCGQAVQQVRVFDYAAWRLVALDTTHQPDGRGGGSLSDASLVQLERVLAVDAGISMCIFMHHNALAVNSAWQDEIMLANADAFNAIVAAHPQVKGVVCGHVHQEFDLQQGAARYLATPSSAVQFSCQQQNFQLEPELGPGLRLLQLTAKGQLQTQVQRLPKLAAGHAPCP